MHQEAGDEQAGAARGAKRKWQTPYVIRATVSKDTNKSLYNTMEYYILTFQSHRGPS